MASSRFEWLARIKGIEREYNATRYATDFLLIAARREPPSLRSDLQVRDIDKAAERLEGTYTIRLFAEFETCLRLFWDATQHTRSPRRTRDLLDGVGARRRIPYDRIDAAHSVRAYRNSLVHESEEDVGPTPIAATRSRLCHYLSFLPNQW